MVGAIGIGRQVAAAMRGDDFQAGEAVERALEDQVRQRDRGFQRIADGVAEPAVAGQPLAGLGHALRMDEQRHAELLGLGPYRMELGIRKLHAGDDAADGGALQPLLLHRGLEFLDGEIGRLQGERGESGEAVRLGSTELG
jgi:hypothetical protein